MGGAAHRLTIIGDIGVDLVLGPLDSWPRVGTETVMERSELRAGGSAANAALAVSYLGGSAALLSNVGNDELGRWLHAELHALGATLEVCEAATTLTVGLLHSCGERTFFTTRGHLEHLTYELLQPRLAPAPHPNSIVLLSGVFLTPALRRSFPELLLQLRALGYQVALDTNWPPQGWGAALRAEVADWIRLSDHVLLNELEVASLAGSCDLDTALSSLSPLLRPGATLVVKTGARGATALQDGRRVNALAPPAVIFDTIGAGDSFNAGYLLARLQDAALAAAVTAGCDAACAIITRFPRRAIAAGELAAAMAAGASVHGAPRTARAAT